MSHADPNTDGALVRFARDYGWRAYAIPVLVVVTVWLVCDLVFNPGGEDATGDAAGHDHPVSGGLGAGPDPADMSSGPLGLEELPPGGNFTQQGAGTYRVVGTPGMQAGRGEKKVIRYVVEVEEGIDTAGYGGPDAVATMIDATLANPKGWTFDPAFRFEHVAPDAEPNMRIQLTSVATTHELCGHDLGMETSCFYSDGNRVVLNESRWVRGAEPFQGDLGGYRQYLINHEVGHGLGYAAHVPCRENGELAPVMMQQTLSLNNSVLHGIDPAEAYPDDDKTCLANPWPYPKVPADEGAR